MGRGEFRMKDELRQALEDLMSAGRLTGATGVTPEKWEQEISMAEGRILALIAAKIPQEKEVVGKYEYVYNKALKDVRKALEVAE
jgi:hypothetical protein